MRVAVKFSRDDRAKYVSHLDMQRSVQRMLARANLPCEYSGGFNPHMVLSFASPLPVGLATSGDYFEFSLLQNMELMDILKELNKVCPAGIALISVCELSDNQKKLMANVCFARYKITLNNFEDAEKLKTALNQNEFNIITKRGKEIDAKPLVHSLIVGTPYMVDGINNVQCELTVSFSSGACLNPEDLLKGCGISGYSILRLDLLRSDMRPLI